MIVIGHRGASGEYTENTLQSFNAAIAQKADMLELDIQQTLDKKIVVYHDSHFKDGVNVSDVIYTDFKSRTQRLNVEALLLEDVLSGLDAKIKINIEVKRLTIVDLLIEAIGDYPIEKLLFSSFDHKVIAAIKEKYPQVATGTLMVSCVLNPLPLIESLQSDVLCQHYGFVNKEFVDMVHKAGKKIYVWVVNYEPDMLHFKVLGVDGIFTDYPERAKKVLDL